MPTFQQVTLAHADPAFTRLGELLELVQRTFAYMDGVIDPPSSMHQLTIDSLRVKCAEETGIVAMLETVLIGCAFLAERQDHLYLNKFAVAPGHQGCGVGRVLMARAEEIAREAGKPVIELQTRIELTQNHTAFARFGFEEVARTAHPG